MSDIIDLKTKVSRNFKKNALELGECQNNQIIDSISWL